MVPVKKYCLHPQKFHNPDATLQKEWENLKEVLCDNEYMKNYKIMVGQKIGIKSMANVWTSIHADTSNIYSHFFFALLFFWVAFKKEGSIFWLYLAAGSTFIISAIYHTIRNYSRKIYDIALNLDVSSIGIQVFMFNFVDCINLFKDTRPDITRNYLIGFGALFTICLSSIPIILKHKLYALRTTVFCLMASLGFPLIIHGSFYYADSSKLHKMIFLRVFVFLFCGIGLGFRSSHIPERFHPDTIFQSFFHSHFIFHVLVSIGSFCGCLSSEALL